MSRCHFRSQSSLASRYSKDFPFTNDGFRAAVADAKKDSQRSGDYRDVQIICNGVRGIHPGGLFLMTCGMKRDGNVTCDTRYSGPPHGGLGSKKKRRR